MINSQPSLQQAAREIATRRQARQSFLDFVRYIRPDYTVNWHHRLLCEYLDRFVSGDINKLMVNMPPQHGKSELVSRKLPAYILGKNPETKIITASYAATLIESMNRDTQRTMDTQEYISLFPDTRLNSSNIRTAHGVYLRNNEIFEIVGHTGAYKCAGVGGSLTGFPADIGIIDDPYKDYAEARSETVRRGVWEWYTSTFLSRTHVNTRLLITQTRWHEQDLSGMLLDLEGETKDGGEWTVLSLPAIAEPEVEPPHPLDTRPEGIAMWPDKFPTDMLLKRRKLNGRQFEALYQQRPRPLTGNMFDRTKVRTCEAVPYYADRVRRWDMAATEDGGDWTVGILMARVGGEFFIEDYIAVQLGTYARNTLIINTAARDAALYNNSVLQLGPQDPAAAGKDAALYFMRLLAGYPVATEIESGSKELRAEPISDQWGAGNVYIKQADWNDAYLTRMELFPHGGKDEADATSGAFNHLALHWQQELERIVTYDDRVHISSF